MNNKWYNSGCYIASGCLFISEFSFCYFGQLMVGRSNLNVLACLGLATSYSKQYIKHNRKIKMVLLWSEYIITL